MAHGKVSDADLAIGPPFPAAKPDDVEDVAWALSTAEANWNRGDHADAIKWIRRAAEAAAEAELDDRALELAKAAADLASLIVQPPQDTAQGSAKAGPSQAPSAPPPAGAREGKGPSRSPSGKHAAAPPHPMITTPRSLPPPRTAASGASPSQSPKAPAGARAQAPQPSLPKVVPASRASERRAGRKSAHNLAEEAKRARTIASDEEGDPEVTRALPGKRASGTSEARRRTRASRPATDEVSRTARTLSPSTDVASATAAEPVGEPPASDRELASQPGSVGGLLGTTEEIDQWPTQSLTNDELTNLTDVRDAGSLTQLEVSRSASSSRKALEPGLPTTQAMRVVVWRSGDGVRVAPAGTRVSAITIDAMLVAIDPSADLAAWLAKK